MRPTVAERIELRTRLGEAEVRSWKGKFLDDRHYDYLITSDADVYKPDGSPLLIFRRNEIPWGLCDLAYPHFRRAARKSFNRGTAAGGKRHFPMKKDGTRSKTNTARPAESAPIGFMDATPPRFPVCRTTSWSARNWGSGWRYVQPYIRHVDGVFARLLPDRYAAQLEAVKRTPSHLVIDGTVFTTVTVNRNFQTAVHTDSGDLAAGFGVMTAMSAGEYTGGYFVFPRYRIAVLIQTGDVLLADVHEHHGNTAMYGDRFERISTVMYFRSKMVRCRS